MRYMTHEPSLRPAPSDFFSYQQRVINRKHSISTVCSGEGDVGNLIPIIFGGDYSGNFLSHRRDGVGDTLTSQVKLERSQSAENSTSLRTPSALHTSR